MTKKMTLLLLVILYDASTLYLSNTAFADTNSSKPSKDIKSKNLVNLYASPEFEKYIPTPTRIVVAENDISVYVFCDGPNRVYVMNTLTATKEMTITRNFPGCEGQHFAGERIPN